MGIKVPLLRFALRINKIIHTLSTECPLCGHSDMRLYHTLKVLDGRSCPQCSVALSDSSDQPPTLRTPRQGEGPKSHGWGMLMSSPGRLSSFLALLEDHSNLA